MRFSGNLENSVAIYKEYEVPDKIEEQETRATLGREVKMAVKRHLGNAQVKRYLRSLDNKTAKSGKMTGDMWLLAALLIKLVAGDDDFPLMNKEGEGDEPTTVLDVRKKLYGYTLRSLGLHRVQVIERHYAAQIEREKQAALETAAAEKESLDLSGE